MILPTPPPSIRPQRTGDSEQLPDYAPPAAFEAARLRQEVKHRNGQGWLEDVKQVEGSGWHEQVIGALQGRETSPAVPALPSRTSLVTPSSLSFRSGSASSSADVLLERLLEQATEPPRWTVRVQGQTPRSNARSFDFCIDLRDEVKAGVEGGRRAVLSAAHTGASQRRSASALDLEHGAGCLRAGRNDRVGGHAERGLPSFVHSSSLADIGSPGASPLHPAQLYQGLFVDVAEVHSTGFLPAADYPQYHEITRQHVNRALQTQALLEQYCCSRSPLKKLVLEKEVYGWDLGRLRGGLESCVKTTADVTSLNVSFEGDNQPIIIRPSSSIALLLDLSLLMKLMLCFTVVYPIFLLICHVLAPEPTRVKLAFPLTSWRLLPPVTTLEAAEELASTLVQRRPIRVARAPSASQDEEHNDWLVLVGTTEAEWLSKAEETIRAELRRRERKQDDSIEK